MITLHLTKGFEEVFVDPSNITVVQPTEAGGSFVVCGPDWRIRVNESPTEIRALMESHKGAQHVAS